MSITAATARPPVGVLARISLDWWAVLLSLGVTGLVWLDLLPAITW